jgi:uncharacterized membrane protein
MEIWRLVAHRHWITLDVFGRKLRLCARCTGYALGFLALTAVISLQGLQFFGSLSPLLQVSACLLLLAPLTLDWMTQSWGLRESNNGIRLLTGFSLGSGVSLFSLVDATRNFKVLFYLYAAMVIALGGTLGKRMCGSPACNRIE